MIPNKSNRLTIRRKSKKELFNSVQEKIDMGWKVLHPIKHYTNSQYNVIYYITVERVEDI